MFLLRDIDENVDLGYTEKPQYIKRNPRQPDIFMPVKDAIQAEGIAFNSAAYNLFGRAPLEEGRHTVMVLEYDSGDLVFQSERTQANLDYMAMMLGISIEEEISVPEEEEEEEDGNEL